MPAALPVGLSDMLAFLNLPTEVESNSIFKMHRPMVLETIKSVIVDNFYHSSFVPKVGEEDPLFIAFQSAFCFFMLHIYARLFHYIA